MNQYDMLETAFRNGFAFGRIVYINRQHRYYLAEYPVGRQVLREAFKYAEEG